MGSILKSRETETEVIASLKKKRLASIIDPVYVATLADMLARAEPVTIITLCRACRDPRDDKFLELAVNGRADVIVSGDKDLLALHPFRGIPILTPAEFLEWVTGRG